MDERIVPTRRESIAELLERTSYPVIVGDICQDLDVRQRSSIHEDLEHMDIMFPRKAKAQEGHR